VDLKRDIWVYSMAGGWENDGVTPSRFLRTRAWWMIHTYGCKEIRIGFGQSRLWVLKLLKSCVMNSLSAHLYLPRKIIEHFDPHSRLLHWCGIDLPFIVIVRGFGALSFQTQEQSQFPLTPFLYEHSPGIQIRSSHAHR
jgi:hypothetical protein